MRTTPPAENRSEVRYIALFAAIAVSSFLWILTIANMTIVTFPPDALYFFSSLPSYYWLGLSMCGVAMVLVIADDSILNEQAKFLVVLLLILYLYGVPVFTYESPRYTDPYTHLARALFIIAHGSWTSQNVLYLSEFPTAYVQFAIILITTKLPPLILMNFFPIFVVIALSLLVYMLARAIGVRKPIIASMFFVAINPFPQFHLSPQSLAFIPYLVFFLLLLRKEPSRMSMKTVILSIILFLTIMSSNPTTGVFIMTVIALSVASLFLVSRRRSHYKLWQLPSAFVFFLFLSITSWFSFVATLTSNDLVKLATVMVGELNQLNTLAPNYARGNPSYALVVRINEIWIIVSWSFALLSMLMILSKRRSLRANPWLFTWFVGAFVFLPFGILTSPAFAIRSFLYSLVPLSLIAALVLELRATTHGMNRYILKGLKAFGLVALLVAPGVLTVSRYGDDSFNYIPSSSLHAADFLAVRSVGNVLILSAQAWEFRFYRASYGGSPDTGVSTSGSSYFLAVGYFASEKRAVITESNESLTHFDEIVFVDWTLNVYLVREGSTQLVNQQRVIEGFVAERENLIFADSTARIYAQFGSS